MVDGGVSDNLGLRGLLEALEEVEASPAFQREVGLRRHSPHRGGGGQFALGPGHRLGPQARAPGIVSQLLQSSSVPIDHFSYESVELLKDIAQRWADKRELDIAERRLSGMSKAQAEASVLKLSFDAIDVSFDAIEDPEEQRYFMNLPTSFVLPAEAVDRLRALGGRQLRESPTYRRAAEENQTNQRPPHKAEPPSQ